MADIEKMKKKLEEMKAKIKAAESREAKKKRTEDTRRKILLGAIAMEDMQSDKGALNYFMKKLDEKLTRPQDRALFRLKPKPPEPKSQQQAGTPSAEDPPTGVK